MTDCLNNRYHYLFDFDRFKLYPCMVLEFSTLKEWYEDGRFTPYFERDPQLLYDVIKHFLEGVHPYQRVERVVRDIPASKSDDKPSYFLSCSYLVHLCTCLCDSASVCSTMLRMAIVVSLYLALCHCAHHAAVTTTV